MGPTKRRVRPGGLAPGPPPERLLATRVPESGRISGPLRVDHSTWLLPQTHSPTGGLSLKSALPVPWALKIWRGRSRVGSQETCYRAAVRSSPHPIPQASAGGLQKLC